LAVNVFVLNSPTLETYIKSNPVKMLFSDLLHVVLAIALGFLFALALIPPVLKVAKEKHLFDPPDERKLHIHAIPPLGGVAIFIAFNLSIILASHGLSFYPLRYIIAANFLMFFIGLKDDLITISARKKFAVQIIAVIILIALGNLQITNLHGLFGIQSIPTVAGYLITLFVMVSIINAFNLIDGIDGLASGLAMMASFILGSWFFMAGHIHYSIISFALTGSLAGFFLFNVFGNKNKLFMGDTGSLVVGMIVAVLVVRFNEFNVNKSALYAIGAAPSVSFAIVLLPLIDMLRVMTIRLMSGRSPFSPDKNHIHHRLLELFPNHLTVTLIMVASNLLMVGFALLLNNQLKGNTFQFLLILLASICLSFLPSQLIKLQQLQKRTVPAHSSLNHMFLASKNIKIKETHVSKIRIEKDIREKQSGPLKRIS
jgi:UDP-GlcNAc:undecaprenyl-phosphate/decaprenyl-phosphate GlcNAc-1-phosphate transferase